MIGSEQDLKLLLDALGLATELTRRCREMHTAGRLHPGHKLLRITGRAWARFRRRARMQP